MRQKQHFNITLTYADGLYKECQFSVMAVDRLHAIKEAMKFIRQRYKYGNNSIINFETMKIFK